MKSPAKQPITLITGCSSGIGLAAAVDLAQHGHKVYATMRNTSKKDDLLKAAEKAGVSVEVLPLDVNDNESIAAAAEQIKLNDGRLTNLVNNAGYAHVGVLEEFSDEEVRAQFETNVFGVIRVSRAFLPLMRLDDSPRRTLVNVASIAGRTTYPLMDIYAATKWTVISLTAQWRLSLKPFGIRAVSIEPGALATNFGGHSMKKSARFGGEGSPYKAFIDKVMTGLTEMTSGKGAGGAELAARSIRKAIASRKPSLHHTCGPNSFLVPFSNRFMPYGMQEWYVRRMSGVNKL